MQQNNLVGRWALAICATVVVWHAGMFLALVLAGHLFKDRTLILFSGESVGIFLGFTAGRTILPRSDRNLFIATCAGGLGGLMALGSLKMWERGGWHSDLTGTFWGLEFGIACVALIFWRPANLDRPTDKSVPFVGNEGGTRQSSHTAGGTGRRSSFGRRA